LAYRQTGRTSKEVDLSVTRARLAAMSLAGGSLVRSRADGATEAGNSLPLALSCEDRPGPALG